MYYGQYRKCCPDKSGTKLVIQIKNGVHNLATFGIKYIFQIPTSPTTYNRIVMYMHKNYFLP